MLGIMWPPSQPLEHYSHARNMPQQRDVVYPFKKHMPDFIFQQLFAVKAVFVIPTIRPVILV